MRIRDVGSFMLTAGLALALAVPPVSARPGDRDDDDHRRGRSERHHDGYRGGDRHDRDRYDRDRRGYDHDRRDWHRYDRRPDVHVHHTYRPAPPPGWWGHGHRPVVHYHVPPQRRRVYRDVVVVRPYGHWYSGYGHYHRDDDAFFWLGLTGITLALLNNINENQQRALEQAQIRATSAPIGQPIYWSDGGANGQVVALREGRTGDGGYCREFQQTVMIGGRAEDAYGTACRMPDGAWQVVNDQP